MISFGLQRGSAMLQRGSRGCIRMGELRFLGSTTTAQGVNGESSEQQQQHRFYPVYVHHVSKTVLKHLQEAHASWLTAQGLDRGLRVNANGTFVLQFPPKQQGFDSGRIWTSYDTSTKQHWLSVYRQKLVGRFLLKDNVKTAQLQSSVEHADQRIRKVADEMVATLSRQTTTRGRPL